MANQPGHKLDSSLLAKYYALPQPSTTIQAEYIWIGGSGQDVRSKTRVCDEPIYNII
jgi:glutamine synthetase